MTENRRLSLSFQSLLKTTTIGEIWGKRLVNTSNYIGERYDTIPNHYSVYGDKQVLTRNDKFKVYKGRNTVFLVDNTGLVKDLYEWDILGNEYRYAQQEAQREWGLSWHIG